MIRSFQGKAPAIADSAFVSEEAHIIGDVTIDAYSSVWPGAVIRGDLGKITIGKYTEIEDNCVLHSGTYTGPDPNLKIGNYVQIGHGAVVNGRSIGSHTLIGMNATILHDVEIGEYCIIGALCMVSHAMTIPDRSFVVGIPAKIIGKVTQEQLQKAELGTKFYQGLVQKYKDEEK